jgi:hypothetical protein
LRGLRFGIRWIGRRIASFRRANFDIGNQTVNRLESIAFAAWATALLAGAAAASAQQSSYEGFRAHNSAMTAVQPAWVTPLVAPDPRLVQYLRFSFSNQYAPTGTQTVSYGNGRGYGVIAGNRFEFDFMPPAYIQHNSTATDGFGDASVAAKYRIASGNAEHGNFILTTSLSHGFAAGSYKNGAATDCWNPTLAGGIGFFKRFALESALSGAMPTGKIATQGRSIAWNALVQARASSHVRFEISNNATFYFAGSHDGKMQNFVTPAAFYVLRPKSWKPTHLFFIFDGGMQIATSSFHTYNHNLISEMRLIF